MRGAILAHGDATMSGHDLDIEPRLCDAHSNLVEAATGGEYGESAGENSLPRGGEPGSNAHHVLLRDATIEEALWKLPGEESSHSRLGKVSIEDYNIAALST